MTVHPKFFLERKKKVDFISAYLSLVTKTRDKKKWCLISPFRYVNLVVAYQGIPCESLKRNFEQSFLFEDCNPCI